jgi:hypothetical protein
MVKTIDPNLAAVAGSLCGDDVLATVEDSGQGRIE